MKAQTLHFGLSLRGRAVRLKPVQLPAVKRLSFEDGSHLFSRVLRKAMTTLGRQGYALDAAAAAKLDPFAILTGAKPLPLRQAAAAARRRIKLDPICIDCDCTGDGGCKCTSGPCPKPNA